jgi:uncharacterized Zn finger protein
MSRRSCPSCGLVMSAETIGARPGRVVAYCAECDLIVDRADEQDAPRVLPSVLTSSDDRTEREA